MKKIVCLLLAITFSVFAQSTVFPNLNLRDAAQLTQIINNYPADGYKNISLNRAKAYKWYAENKTTCKTFSELESNIRTQTGLSDADASQFSVRIVLTYGTPSMVQDAYNRAVELNFNVPAFLSHNYLRKYIAISDDEALQKLYESAGSVNYSAIACINIIAKGNLTISSDKQKEILTKINRQWSAKLLSENATIKAQAEKVVANCRTLLATF